MRSLLLALPLFLSLSAAFAQSPAAPAGVRALRNLAYVEGGDELQKLDLYLPEKSPGPLPVVIWVHGGGWQKGSKEACPPLRAGYVARGYAVASLAYRLTDRGPFPMQIEDCKAAIRYLRAHGKEHGLDPQRFGVWGSSAGGHLVALLGTSGGVKEFDTGAHLDQSSTVQAVCDWYGPTDFLAFTTTPGYESHATADSPEAKLIGGLVGQNRDKAARAGSITYVDQSDPPFLIMHGDKDPLVPLQQSQVLFAALQKAGVSAHLHTIHGAGHGGPGFTGPVVEAMVSKFFDERLKDGVTTVEATTTESTADLTAAPPRGEASRAQILAQSDTNKDGKITREEFKGAPAAFDRLDRNHDGVLDAADRR